MMRVCDEPPIDDAQRRYASVLRIGGNCGLVLLFATFALYVLEIVPPSVPLAELPRYWGLNVDAYLRATNAAYVGHEHVITGWAWLSVLDRGDYLCFIAIAALCSVTIACYLAVTPGLIRRRDYLYAGMAALEAAVLLLAASGVLHVAH